MTWLWGLNEEYSSKKGIRYSGEKGVPGDQGTYFIKNLEIMLTFYQIEKKLPEKGVSIEAIFFILTNQKTPFILVERAC